MSRENPNLKYSINGSVVRADEYSAPTDRVFRDAWSLDPSDAVIYVDMVKARDVWRDKIRYARRDLFESLDVAMMKAMERGEDFTALVAKKQALRDAPSDPAIDAATTPEELKLVQPINGVIIT